MPICKPSLHSYYMIIFIYIIIILYIFISIILPNHYHMFMLYTRHDKKIHYTDNSIFKCKNFVL